MKRRLLTIAVAATLLPLTAQAAPSVYGRLNLSVDYMDADAGKGTDGLWELNSNASRVGIRGNEKLNEEFTAVYKAEWEVQGDMKEGKDLEGRERYIGLKHFQWGAMRLGYIDSPFKNAEDDVDAFNDLVNLDMQNFIYGQNRLANSINYVSPKFLDVFGANISLQPGEKADNANENHLADGISAAFSYEDDSLYLSFAMDKEITNMDAMRFNVRYKLGDTTLSAMFQTAEPTLTPVGASLDQEAIVVSGSYKMEAITLRGQVLMSTKETGGAGDENETTLMGVGLDYNFTQNTKAFANLAVAKAESMSGGKSTDTDTTFLGFGMETRF